MEQAQETFQELSDRVWVSDYHQALVTFSDSPMSGDLGKVMNIKYGPSKDQPGEIMYWGAKNCLPQEREDLVKGNGNIGELIRTKRDFIIGGGLVAYRSKWENGAEVKEYIETPANIQAWFDEVDINRYLMKACKNLLIHGNVFTEFVRLKRGTGIASIECLECRHTRAEKQDSFGYVRNYYWSGKWHKLREKDTKVERIPAYNKSEKQPKFVLHTGDDLLYDDYYYNPTWWGSKDWVRLANSIPEFHLANILNGYTIRYHIEVPKDYFVDYSSGTQSPNGGVDKVKKEAAAKEEFKQRLDAFLAGASNAGKAVYSDYTVDRSNGKEIAGIKIHTITVDLKDEALLKLHGAAIQALTAAQGIHPTLANIAEAGKLSSGSEMRNAHLVYLKTKTPISRSILLEAIYLFHRENQWDKNLKWEFRDIIITNLDQSKSGTMDETKTEDGPTA